MQGSTPRFVFDQHDAAPVLLEEKFPQTPLRRPLMTTARTIERWSFAAAGLVVFANAEYRARAERDGLLCGDSEVVPNGWSLPDVPPDPRWRDGADHLLAYVGTIGEQDNVDRLVDAVAELGVPGRVRVVVAGAGSALEAVRRRARSAASPAPSSGSGSCETATASRRSSDRRMCASHRRSTRPSTASPRS